MLRSKRPKPRWRNRYHAPRFREMKWENLIAARRECGGGYNLVDGNGTLFWSTTYRLPLSWSLEYRDGYLRFPATR